jgi:hypothetical protein
LLAGLGLDVGTLAVATIAIEAGAALRLGPGEARALLRYGVPSTRSEHEQVAAATSATRGADLRADFAVAALDYCLGLDRAQWLAACGGLELALKRTVHSEGASGEPRRERRRVALALAPSAGVAFTLRAATLQPRLELAAQWPLLVDELAAQPLAVRALLGGAVSF